MVMGMGERSVLPADQYVASLARKRIAACLDASEAGSVAALENGSPAV
jgi:hypothetical protein